MQQVSRQSRFETGLPIRNSPLALQTPLTAARVYAPLQYKKKARCTEVHRAPWYSAGRILLSVQLLPRILHRGAHRFDLDVGELAADSAHFAQILVLHDVAAGRLDRDRSPLAVRVLEILQELHGAVRVELAFLLLDRVHDGRHPVVAAHGDEGGRLVRAVVALPRGDETLLRRTRRASP